MDERNLAQVHCRTSNQRPLFVRFLLAIVRLQTGKKQGCAPVDLIPNQAKTYMIPIFIVPHGMAAINIIISALMGVLGQYFITTGYLYISASGGGLVSSSRIVFATALGAILFGEAITLRTVAGGLCILVSIIGIVLFTRDKRANNEKKIVFE